MYDTLGKKDASLNIWPFHQPINFLHFFLKSIPFLGYFTAMCQEIIVKSTQIHNDCKVNDSLQAGQYLICTVVSSDPVNMINKSDRSFQATISEWRTVKVETNKRHKYMELKTLRIHE